MKRLKLWIISFVFFLSFTLSLFANDKQDFPVLYKGRYRPVEAYARLWLYDRYHSTSLKKQDLAAFHTHSSSPLAFLWSLEILGYAPYQSAPLFWIKSAELKKKMNLQMTRDRFSYHELQPFLNQNLEKELQQDKKLSEEWNILLFSIKEFEKLSGKNSPIEELYQNRLIELQTKDLSPKEIERLLEQEYPLIQRLENAGSLFKVLPSRYKEGEWFPLKALKVNIYHPKSQQLQQVSNFTLFSDVHFQTILKAYLELEKAYEDTHHSNIQLAEFNLSQALIQAYHPLAGTIVQQAHHKQLTYPSLNQLNIETFYVSYLWIPLLITIYGIGAILLFVSYQQEWSIGNALAIAIISLALLFHTILLIMRCYILERPPVSNMFETVIYVPWVAACTSLFFPTFRRFPLALVAACITSIGLLIILEVTDLNQSLDQVQAVLDSQFWLLIHVLLVVGSYGIFILGAILGHFYLGMFMSQQQENLTMKRLSQIILQTMYGGTAMLIAGTILGGIWAAESWGRFWDWDPKESWAFISCCFYLIWIHAYRFHRIASFGLAIGAVSGLLTISFTWYGVNYILGTGLHSYGFGSGGEHYYYVFLGIECLFLGIALFTYLSRNSYHSFDTKC